MAEAKLQDGRNSSVPDVQDPSLLLNSLVGLLVGILATCRSQQGETTRMLGQVEPHQTQGSRPAR